MTLHQRSPHLTELGKAVRVQRARVGVSQEKAARAAGLNRNYIGALERGEMNPTYETLTRLADSLDVPLHVLIADATEMQRIGARSAGRAT